MTDLTKIEKPYGLCTQEEQEGLTALIGIEGALQSMDSFLGTWITRPSRNTAFRKGCTYRQNPAWQPPTIDVPDWFWEATGYDYVAMDRSGQVYAYKYKPKKAVISWDETGIGLVRLDKLFTRHDFNPHKIPWNKSLTVRPGLEE